MANSERVAIAAHLHVALRRKAGRVTDTEWMAVNDEYAREVVRFAFAKAREHGDESLADWARKLALHMQASTLQPPPAAPLLARVTQQLRSPAPVPAPEAQDGNAPGRYIGGLR